MNSNWQFKSLGEVCEIIKRGISPKYTDKKGIIVINQKCIRDHKINLSYSRLHNSELKSVTEEKFVKFGDVLINSTGTGTLGRVAQVRDKDLESCTVDTHVTIVRPKNELFYMDFFGYALIKIENEIEKAGEGTSGQTELVRTKLQNDFKISYPLSTLEQKQIVEILDKSFEAIDKAKANIEKNIQNTKELFQSRLNEIFSQKGESWEEKTLGEVCEMIKRGISPKYTEEDGIIVINQKCIRDHKINLSLSRLHNNSLKAVNIERIIKIGDVLINSTGTGTLGRIAQVRNIELAGCTVDSHVTIVRPFNELFYIDFFGYALIKIEKEIENSGEGTSGQTELSRIKLQNDFKINYPNCHNKQKEIVLILDSLKVNQKQLEQKYKQKLKNLEELKKSILEKAFSGELLK